MKYYFYIPAFALCLFSCEANDNPWSSDWEQSENNWGNSSSSATTDASEATYSSSDAAYDVRNFSIEWESLDESSFVDESENTSILDSDDLVENSSFSTVIKIVYNGESVSVTGEAKGVTVDVDGAHVMVTSDGASGIEYALSGSSTNGQFKLYSSKKAKVSLDNLSLINTTGSAINIQSKKRVFIVLAKGSSNDLTDASSYNTIDGEDEKATVFSEGQLIFSGSGSLTVTGNYKHGICSDQYILVRPSANISINAKKDAIHVNDGFIQSGGILVLKSTSGDAIDSEASININGGLIKASVEGTATKGLKADANITISGGKQLIITSGPAEYDSDEKDFSSCSCLKCDTTMTISGGSMLLKSTGSGGKGINVGGEMNISGGEIYILTTGSVFSYNNDTSSPKGMKVTGNLNISDGKIRVRSLGASEGSEGIESKAQMYISGGDIAVYTADDAFNAKKHIEISGGNVYAYATDNDGIDSNGTLSISGGTIISSGTREPEEGFDCDQNTFSITGGTLIGTGGGTSSPTSSKCTQNVVVYGTSASGGTVYTVTDSDGNHIFSYTIPRTYSTLKFLFSTANLQNGDYIVYSGGTVSGGTEYNGLVTGASFSDGTKVTSFTISNRVTTIGTTGGGMGGGGFGRW